MADSDFLAGRYRFANPGVAGAVINEGVIHAMPGGVVALIALRVENDGAIQADGGSAALLAGDGLINYVIDEGAVQAQTGNHAGIVRARTLENRGGKIGACRRRREDRHPRRVWQNGNVADRSDRFHRGGIGRRYFGRDAWQQPQAQRT